MKLAIIGDTHNHHKSIEYVVNAEKNWADKFMHMGDLAGGKKDHLFNRVGLEKSIALMYKENITGIDGNHDRQALKEFSHLISYSTKTYLSNVPEQRIMPGLPKVLFMHISPGNKNRIPNRAKYEKSMRHMNQDYSEFDIIVHGHSHISSVTSQDANGNVEFEVAPETNNIIKLSKDKKYLIDVGMSFNFSPARVYNGARYVLFDTDKMEIMYKDIEL